MNRHNSNEFFLLKWINTCLVVLSISSCVGNLNDNHAEKEPKLYYSFNPIQLNGLHKIIEKDTINYYWGVENCSPNEEEFNKYISILTKGAIVESLQQIKEQKKVIKCIFYDVDITISDTSKINDMKPLIVCSFKSNKIKVEYCKSKYIIRDSMFFVEFDLSKSVLK